MAEHKHQHILNVERSLYFQFTIHIYYWGDCVLIAIYLINRTLSPLLGNKNHMKLYTRVLLLMAISESLVLGYPTLVVEEVGDEFINVRESLIL